jgi:hypothetical protein
MKRHLFLLAGGAAVLAGCSHHGGILPSLGNQRGATGSGADYMPVMALPTEPIVGEVRRFDGPTAPASWAFCDGSLVKVRDCPSLFNLLRKSEGGDGVTTFGLPKSTRATFVIAVQGATPQNPQQLAAIFAKRPHLSASVDGSVAS